MFFQKKGEKLAFLTQSKAKLCKNLIVTVVFEKTPFYPPKIVKIVENCDYNIDPLYLCQT
jgi:hypothetical protein